MTTWVSTRIPRFTAHPARSARQVLAALQYFRFRSIPITLIHFGRSAAGSSASLMTMLAASTPVPIVGSSTVTLARPCPFFERAAAVWARLGVVKPRCSSFRRLTSF